MTDPTKTTTDPAPTTKGKKLMAAYIDDRKSVEFRGYKFKKDEPIEVDEKTWAKLKDHPCFKVSGG